MPSGCAVLTDARCFRSARIAARSIFSAASASGAREGAACRLVTASSTMLAESTRRGPRSKREQLIDLPLAVRKRLHSNSSALEQRQVQVGERRGLGIFDVPATLQAGSAAAAHEDRQV